MARLPREYFDRRSDVVSLLCVTGHMLLVFAAPVVAAYAGPAWWWILAWGFLGSGMNGLLNLMHESAHALVFRGKGPSEFLGRYVLAPLVFADFDGYKARHWQHHRCLGVEGETKDTYVIEIHGTKVLRLLLRCLSGAEALRKFSGHQTRQDEGRQPDTSNGWYLRVVVVQALLAGVLSLAALAGHRSWQAAFVSAVAAYGFIYLYGLMSLTVFAAALRAIAEHQIHGASDVQGYAALRNFKCNAVTRFLMGAYGFGEHETHHLHPGIPYYNLPSATTELVKEQPSLTPRHGYFTTLLHIMRTDQARHPDAASARVS
ncbi:MAG TPA: fatty acid desaturase [Vicinamibacterales bacterium]|jgi:fatty acid desaturase